MSIATADLLSAISDLTTIKEMKVTITVTAQCGLISAVSVITGGLLGGPAGIAFGGLIGTALSSFHASGKFKSVPEILMTEATTQQREKLADAIRNVLTAENILSVVQFVALIQSDKVLMDTILKLVRDFLSLDMGYRCLS